MDLADERDFGGLAFLSTPVVGFYPKGFVLEDKKTRRCVGTRHDPRTHEDQARVTQAIPWDFPPEDLAGNQIVKHESLILAQNERWRQA